MNRKTTVTTFPEVTFYASVSSDSDTDQNMTRRKPRVKNPNAAKLRNSAKPKIRNCDKCCNIVANGDDMYRFYRMGLTVCKSCWITIDPSKEKAKRPIRKSSTETKLCTVFLKDVLSEESLKSGGNIYKIEKDGNKIYVVSDENSQDEDGKSSSVSPKIENHIVNGSAKQTRKRRVNITKSDVESPPSKVKELKRNTKHKVNMSGLKSLKVLSDTEQPSTSFSKWQKRKKNTDNDQSSDSDIAQRSPRSLRSSKLGDSTKRNLSSASEGEEANKRNRKKLRSILEGVTANVQLEINDESSSNEGNTSLRKKKTKDAPAVGISKTETDIKRETHSRTSPISNKEMTPPAEFKSPKSIASSEGKSTEYCCDKCSRKFDTKLSIAEHKLTHLKQATLKLIRIDVPSDEEKQETKTASQESQVHSKEAATRLSGAASTDDPSEEIDLNVEDDTDEEEIFSLSKNKSARKGEKKEKCSEDGEGDDATDKPAAEKEEEQEESTKIESDKIAITKKSQQRKDTMDESDKTIILAEIEEDENTKDKDTESPTDLKDKDNNHAQEATVVTAENHKDLDVEEDKNSANAENDIETLAVEKEKSVTNCNDISNDKADLDDQITFDNKATESSVLSTAKDNEENEKESESFKNNLKNGCKDRNNEKIMNNIMEALEQCDLTNDCQKKGTKEPKKKETIDDSCVIDKTKMLHDKEDSIIVVDEDKVEEEGSLDRLRNKTDEQDVEIEVVDKPSNAKDKSDLVNCEKVDSAKKSDVVIEYDVMTISMDSDNETAPFETRKMTTESMIETINDSIEEERSEKDTSDFEQLLGNSMASKNCEVQENLKHASSNSSINAASEILREVFDLAADEVQKREDEDSGTKSFNDVEMETLENISREIRNSADMPSLDPISVMEVDDVNDITLN